MSNNMVGGVVLVIIAVMIGIMLFPSLMSSTDDIQYEDTTQTAYSSTGVGETTDDVVLTDPLFEGDTANVSDITSDNAGDTPAASSYTDSTDTLTVSGLAASGTRNLTIDFEADSLSGYTGMSDFVKLTPFVILGGLVLAGFFALYRGATTRG